MALAMTAANAAKICPGFSPGGTVFSIICIQGDFQEDKWYDNRYDNAGDSP
jgi:hypothetical protein